MLAGRIGQAVNFIEITMVQLLQDRLKSLSDLIEVHDPPAYGSYRSADMKLHAKGMAVESGTFVTLWCVRQPMSRFK